MKRLLLILCCLVLSGCERPAPLSPAEDEAQATRMRGFLRDSSPRNMNEHPKVVPEFTTNFDLNKSRDKAQAVAADYSLDELTDSSE
jgi:hypothetical protein